MTILITGTGRAGTSFLAGVLLEVGIKGEHPDNTQNVLTPFDESVRAGRETILPLIPPLPTLIKSPALAIELDKLLDDGILDPNDLFVICPVRRFEDAARSREEAGLRYWANYGLTEDQVVGRVVETCILRDIDLTLLAFPQLVQDPEYVWKKLKNTLLRLEISKDKFIRSHRKLLKEKR